MKTTTCSFSIYAAVLLAGCATAPEPKPEPPTAPKARAMAVHSIPSDMMVMVDDEWAGITPCTIMLPADSTGGFVGPLLTIIKAVPVTGGLPDTKIWWPGQRIPSRVVFSLPWAPPQPAKKADLVVAP
jgi:hypothetical protein